MGRGLYLRILMQHPRMWLSFLFCIVVLTYIVYAWADLIIDSSYQNWGIDCAWIL